jgi:hypothetical protein
MPSEDLVGQLRCASDLAIATRDGECVEHAVGERVRQRDADCIEPPHDLDL